MSESLRAEISLLSTFTHASSFLLTLPHQCRFCFYFTASKSLYFESRLMCDPKTVLFQEIRFYRNLYGINQNKKFYGLREVLVSRCVHVYENEEGNPLSSARRHFNVISSYILAARY